jgi:hypothetical protein
MQPKRGLASRLHVPTPCWMLNLPSRKRWRADNVASSNSGFSSLASGVAPKGGKSHTFFRAEAKTAPAPNGGRAEAVVFLACVRYPPDVDIIQEHCHLFPKFCLKLEAAPPRSGSASVGWSSLGRGPSLNVRSVRGRRPFPCYGSWCLRETVHFCSRP